MDVKGKVLLGC